MIGTSIISGPTGASGGDGIRFFEDGEYSGDVITFFLTDGTTLGVTGARGNTGSDVDNDYSIINTIESDGYGQIFKVKSGATAFFRNLTISGTDISLEEKDYTILLKGRTYDYGVMGNTGELLYQYNGLSAHGALNTYWDNDNNNLLARILVHREIWGKVEGVGKNNNFSFNWDFSDYEEPTNLDTVPDSQRTDGKSVPFSNLTLVNIVGDGDTELIQTAYELSSKIHLGQTGNSDGSSADIIHTFPGVTFTSQIGTSIIGSCCYCENKGEGPPDGPNCIDYVTNTYCDNVGGIFGTSTCLNRPEGPDCFVEGSCCVFSELGSTCIQSSEDNCTKFGGFFISDLTCDELDFIGGCPDPCPVEGACCINNVCFDMGEYECSFYPNSIWFNDSCENVNCCLEGQYGACCLDEKCYNTTPTECTSYQSSDGSRGIFWGVGSKCAGPYEESRYYAHDCTNEDGQTVGQLEDGACPDGSSPPCTECIGWTQIVSDECVDDDGIENICKCLEDAGGPIQCDCDCNACGSNSEESCGSIKLVDGTCWECCCGSIDLPTTDPPTTTQEPLGYCCDSNFSGDDCYYYDENGDLVGNCLWRCYMGVIGACIDVGFVEGQGDEPQWNHPCGLAPHSTTYFGYMCAKSLWGFLRSKPNDYYTNIGEALVDWPAPGSMEEYQGCGGQGFDGALIHDNGNMTDIGWRWEWTVVRESSNDSPWCAIGYSEGLPLYDHCPNAGLGVFPCDQNLGEPLDCPNGPGGVDGNPCIPDDCCPPDVTTNPPFPGGGFPTTEPPVLPLVGGNNDCYLSTSSQCAGQWYPTLEQCQTQSACGGDPPPGYDGDDFVGPPMYCYYPTTFDENGDIDVVGGICQPGGELRSCGFCEVAPNNTGCNPGFDFKEIRIQDYMKPVGDPECPGGLDDVCPCDGDLDFLGGNQFVSIVPTGYFENPETGQWCSGPDPNCVFVEGQHPDWPKWHPSPQLSELCRPLPEQCPHCCENCKPGSIGCDMCSDDYASECSEYNIPGVVAYQCTLLEPQLCDFCADYDPDSQAFKCCEEYCWQFNQLGCQGVCVEIELPPDGPP